MIKYNTEEDKKERQLLKDEFEKVFNANNWVETMDDQEYIREYAQQYQIFISGYYLSKR